MLTLINTYIHSIHMSMFDHSLVSVGCSEAEFVLTAKLECVCNVKYLVMYTDTPYFYKSYMHMRAFTYNNT